MAIIGNISTINVNGNELTIKDAALTEIVNEIIDAIGQNNEDISERINNLDKRSFDALIKISSQNESEIASIQDGLYKVQYVTVTGEGDNATETLNNSAILIQKGTNQYLYKDGQLSSRTKENNTWGNWITFEGGVTSVNGQTGAVTVKENVQSDWNATTGDAVILNKPTIPTVPTTSTTVTENDTNPVSGGAVYAKFEDLIGSAPAALDTLGEIATALNNDADLAGTLTNQIAGKISKVSPATAGNFASLNSDGTLVDSGHKHSDYLTEAPVTSVDGMTGAVTITHPVTSVNGMTGAITLGESYYKYGVREDDGISVKLYQQSQAGADIVGSTNSFDGVVVGGLFSGSRYSTNATISYIPLIAADENSIPHLSYSNSLDPYVGVSIKYLKDYVSSNLPDLPPTELSDDYATSTDTNDDLLLAAGDTYEEAFGKLEKAILDNSEVAATAIQEVASNTATSIQEVTSNMVVSVNGMTGAVVIPEGGVTSFNGATGAVTYTAPVTSVNGQTGAVNINIGVTSFNGSTGAITYTAPVTSVNGATGAVTVKANVQSDWNATTGDAVILNKPTIPAAVTESTVAGWGFTKNTGTLTAETQLSKGTATGTGNAVTDINVSNHQITLVKGATYATQSDIDTSIANLVNSAPTTLDTLKELADALGNDANFATTVSNQIAAKYTKPSTGIPPSDLAEGVIPDVPVQSVNGQTGAVSLALGDTNVIETIKVNNTALTPVSKAVNITVPTKTSDLTNDSGFITNAPVTSVNGQTGAVTVKANVQSDWNATTGDAVILNKPTIPTVNDSTVTLTMNGNTVGTFTLNKSGNTTIDLGTVLTSHQSIKTVNNESLTGTGNISINGLPTVTSADNGKVLMVVNGAWQLVSPVSLYSGSSTPSNSQGNNGDLYVQS